MPPPDGHTEGVYFGPKDESLPGDLKSVFKHRRDPFSMSQEIRYSMRMHITVQEALTAVGLDSQFEGEGRKDSRAAESRKRQFARQAILEKAERDFGIEIPDDADTVSDGGESSPSDPLTVSPPSES